MAVTASELRANIYRLLDEVIESGRPLEIVRNGVTLRLVAPAPSSWIDRLQARPSVVDGDASDLADVHFDDEWSGEAVAGDAS